MGRENEIVPSTVPRVDLEKIAGSRSYNISGDEIDRDYLRMVEYLCEKWDCEDEEELLDYMDERGIKFWNPLPGENASMYKYFSYFLQLPPGFRTFINTARYVISYEKGISLEELIDTPGAKLAKHSIVTIITRDQLFWYARADRYEKQLVQDLILSVEHSQKERLAAMQQRNLNFAILSNDLSLQMLTMAAKKLQTLSVDDVRPQDIAAWAKAAGMLTTDGQKLMESSLALGDILAMVDEFENATVIDVE